MTHWLPLLLPALMMGLGSCTQKMVCPAYQSAFIYNKDELRKRFSYFNEDSTPKVLSANKNKYLIVEPASYRKKVRQISTVPSRPVNPVVPDSLQDDAVLTAELEAAARSVIDSTYIPDTQHVDSAAEESRPYVITRDREVRVLKYNFPDSLKYDPVLNRYLPERPSYYVMHIGFNTEQDNYMWYLRDVLILPDVRLALEKAEAKDEKNVSEKKSRLRSFFADLFKRKKKKLPDSLETVPVQPRTEEDEYILFDGDGEVPRDTADEVPPVVRQKKSPFSFLKKKKKETIQPLRREPARKEEEDGF